MVNFLLINFPYKVVLCGDSQDKEIGDIIEKATKAKVLNLISSFQEWFALIQNARLVISNESGAVHIAAASKTECVCIGAQEFGESFLPYRPELVRHNDRLPTVVRCDRLNCFYCKKSQRHIDETGEICYLPTGVFPCLGKISVDQVSRTVESILS